MDERLTSAFSGFLFLILFQIYLSDIIQIINFRIYYSGDIMQEDKKSKWMKFGALFAILIMVGSAVFVGILYGLDGLTGGNDNTETAYPFTDVTGNHVNFTFKNAKDAAAYIPAGVLSISIHRIYDNSTIDQGLQEAFPGADGEYRMTASYETGALSYFLINEESMNNTSIMINGSKPQYENYGGYDIIFMNAAQRVVVGNPLFIATFYNYTSDNSLARKAIDVLNGNTSGSSNLNDILVYADDVSLYDEIIVYEANSGSNYTKYYQRSSSYAIGMDFQLVFELESIIMNPTDEMKADVYALAANATEGIEFTITEEDNVLITDVVGHEYEPFMEDTTELYNLISNHTRQGTTA